MFGFKKGKKQPSKFTPSWFQSISDEEFYSERETYRSSFARGNLQAEKYLHLFDKHEGERLNRKYKKEHPHAKTVYREHGWHLYKDED